jgi:hypothetical protein
MRPSFVPHAVEEEHLDDPGYLKKSDGSILSDADLVDLMLRGCPGGDAETERAGPDDDDDIDEEEREQQHPEGGEAPPAERTRGTRGV